MVVRYMGTKRHMAEHVRDTIATLDPQGRVVDLFSGMGSVAESLRETSSVVTNDALSFTAALSRARFTGRTRTTSAHDAAARLEELFIAHRHALSVRYRSRLADELAALESGRVGLQQYMTTAPHVGNDSSLRRRAGRAAQATGAAHYELATLYFSAGYLSLAQAIEVDSLRHAIDSLAIAEDRDWFLGSWIVAVSVLMNAPGHTAQFLRPNTDSAHHRIARTWRRSIWVEFVKALEVTEQVGTAGWRSKNDVHVSDALELIASGSLAHIGAVYADPPYTRDQYSRFYHVYETLYRYDFPRSTGMGRNRPDRFTTSFSLKSAVVGSFHDLCRNVARMQVPLVISYPSAGLLSAAGEDVATIVGHHFKRVEVSEIAAQHSTLGASKGASKKRATESLYVCTS